MSVVADTTCFPSGVRVNSSCVVPDSVSGVFQQIQILTGIQIQNVQTAAVDREKDDPLTIGGDFTGVLRNPSLPRSGCISQILGPRCLKCDALFEYDPTDFRALASSFGVSLYLAYYDSTEAI